MKKNKNKWLRICPKCSSLDVQTDFSNPVVWAYGTTAKYKCDSCGHIAPTFPEVFENKITRFKEKLKQEIKEEKIQSFREDLIDTSTGFWIITYEIVSILVVLVIVLFIAGVYFINKNAIISFVLIIIGVLILTWLIRQYDKYKKRKYYKF